MTLLRNSEVNNFMHTNIHMVTTSVTSYSCFNYYLLLMECKFIYIRQGHYFMIGLNERLYRFQMKIL